MDEREARLQRLRASLNAPLTADESATPEGQILSQDKMKDVVPLSGTMREHEAVLRLHEIRRQRMAYIDFVDEQVSSDDSPSAT